MWLPGKLKTFLYNNYKYIIKPEFRAKQIINKSKGLDSYQKNDLNKIVEILFNKFKNTQNLNLLDIGCSQKQVNILSGFVNKITGINIDFNQQTLNAKSNVEFIIMDGTNLLFDDNTFDFIYSLNVFEHIQNLEKSINEQIRVLKPGGFIYANWFPIWSGAKGHHIHEDMIQIWCDHFKITNNFNYKNNGSIIPDWSHLYFTFDEMKTHLENKIENKQILDCILNVIYSSNDLNRIFFDDFLNIINSKPIKIEYLKKAVQEVPTDILQDLKLKHNKIDFNTIRCELLFTK